MADGPTTPPLRRLFQLIQLEGKDIYHIYFYSILAGLISLSLPLGVQSIISFLMGGTLSASLVVLITIVVGGTLLNGGLQIFKLRIIERVSQRVFSRISYNLGYRIPRLDMQSIDGYHLPELMNRFFEVSTIQKSFSKILLDFPTAITQILIGLILLSIYSQVFLLFGLLLIILLLIFIRYTARLGLQTSLEESDHKYSMAAWLEELSRNVFTFKFHLNEKLPLTMTSNIVERYLGARNRHFNVLQRQYLAVIVFKVLITAVLLIVGSALFINKQLNLGQFIVVDIVIILLADSIEKVIINLDGVYDLLTSLEKAGKIGGLSIQKDGAMKMESTRPLKIQLKEVSFRYQAHMPYIVKNLNLSIEEGERIALVGFNEAGRGTLLKLIAGTFDLYTGNIRINDTPLQTLDPETYREQFSILLEKETLMATKLWDNLTLGIENVDQYALQNLIHIAGLDDYVSELQNGFDTKMDPTLLRVSRHVCHRLLWCRWMLDKKPLMMAEDTWTKWDSFHQFRMTNYMENLRGKSTLLVSTSSKHLIQTCDRVITMMHGEISGIHTVEEFKNHSWYSKLRE